MPYKMDMEKKSISIELKAEKEGSFIARIATLNVRDKDNDITRPGAFTEGKTVLVSAYMHGSWMGKLPVGKATIHEQGDEVIADGQFNLKTSEGRDTYEAVKFAPELQEWSYGFYPIETEDGKDEEEGARILKKLDEKEISPVLVGAGVNTAVLAIKSGEETKPYENEHSCRLEDPDKYDRFARKNCYQKHDGKCIDFIFGVKEGKSEVQAMRYDKDIWTEEAAQNHCKDYKGTFEAAKKSGMAYADQAEAALAAVNELSERTKSLADLRLKEGRVLSPANRDRMKKLFDLLSGVAGNLKELLDSTEPKDEKVLDSLYLQYLEIQNKLREVIA